MRGPKGELSAHIPEGLQIEIKNQDIRVVRDQTKKGSQSLQGVFRANISNMVSGVTNGWTKTLELSGVGYRATLLGENLELTVGYSHPVTIVPPSGIKVSVNERKIMVSGVDKQLVGQIAADIRAVKKPEPYKGKGIRYLDEKVRKKAGKSAKAIGGAPGGK